MTEPGPAIVPTATEWPRYPTLLRPLAIAATLWAVCSLPFVTDAGIGLGGCCLLLPAGALIAVTWLAVSVSLFRKGFRLRPQRAAIVWAITPVVMIGLWLVSWSDLGLVLRLTWNEQELLTSAGAIEPEQTVRHDRRIGLFFVHRIERSYTGPGLAFETVSVFMDSYGLLYLPDGADPPGSWRRLGHVTGNWYRGYWRF